jgi:hypothetical protein
MIRSKKAGLSKSKSKTKPISKNSRPKSSNSPNSKKKRPKSEADQSGAAITFAALAVGHNPAARLSPQDEALFRAFQANLLSLISHELRTPLMGILNSLSLLNEPDVGISTPELIKMAQSNADRLHRTLAALLDLAQLESGVFHARLREIDFAKTVQNRVDHVSKEVTTQGLKTKITVIRNTPILADPQRVSRAVDLCIQAILPRAVPSSTIDISLEDAKVELKFNLKPESRANWEQAWSQAQIGYEGGVASPLSAFGGVMQSEQAFLTRAEEGLGSELLLVHEIMRLHHGKFSKKESGDEITFALSFSEMSSEESLRAVLTSRAYDVSTELGSVALVLMLIPKGSHSEEYRDRVRTHLFRATDAVYALPQRNEVALVLDDCKVEDVPRLLERLKTALTKQYQAQLTGWAHCPADGLDPGKLFDLAQGRMKSSG